MAADRTWHLLSDAPEWPRECEPIDGPPTELWVRGRLELFPRRPRIAIVGSRSPTPYGVGQAKRFSAAFAERGITVTSGMARGIDQAAHEAAMDRGGTTLAVLASGVDRPWPQGPLEARIRGHGCLLSEFPPGTAPRRHHFPLRNRLISALSEGVLVVEAAFASGSLITARWAADQGRAVFAVPGRVDHPMARGCHRLLREGALLAESPEDVLRELGHEPAPPPPELRAETREDSALLEALRGETLTVDELLRAPRAAHLRHPGSARAPRAGRHRGARPGRALPPGAAGPRLN